jgi:uncharacterized protein YggU (UPF0235/DUF167 family)
MSTDPRRGDGVNHGDASVRISVRVRPGASRTRVGGSYAEALVVAVGARAVDGAATKAVLEAVAAAFGVRRSAVALVSGATARTKVLEVSGEPDRLRERFEALRTDS